jgi:glucose/arabinose dehydrogenase
VSYIGQVGLLDVVLCDVRMGPGGAVYVLTDQKPGKLLKLTPK